MVNYYLCGRVEEEACATSHRNLESLRASITKTMARLDKEKVCKSVYAFRGHMEAVIEANRDYIEQKCTLATCQCV